MGLIKELTLKKANAKESEIHVDANKIKAKRLMTELTVLT